MAEDVTKQKLICSNIPTRNEQLNKLKSGKEYDLLVIGGGATGTGVALDATTRGLNVALVERGDFSSCTSSRSTKLIHGGVRYLEKAFLHLDYEQFRMVKEALNERSVLLNIAPHLSNEIPIMIPIYAWWKVPYYWVGSKLYDLVAGTHGLESSYFLGKRKTLDRFPMLKRDSLKASMIYFDGQSNDARMNVAIALTAAAFGADISNYVIVESLIQTKDENGNVRVSGAKVRDTLTNERWEIKAKGVINATGPYTDAIRKMDDPSISDIVAPSAGAHIILPEYYTPSNIGLIDPATTDGRVVFFLPWEGSTLVGTTDTPTKIEDNPSASEADVNWIVEEVSTYLDKDIEVRKEDVLATWSGIRPLVKDPSKPNTESLARNHIVHTSPSKLITVSGGKWTTYRSMALDTVDEAIKVLGLKPKSPCQTEKIYLIGGHNFTKTSYISLIQHFQLENKIAKHLSLTYGDKAVEIAQLAKEHKILAPGYPYLEAEVIYGARHEYAMTAVDVLARRTRLAFLNAQAAYKATPRVIELMAAECGWSKKRQQKEMKDTIEFLKTMGLNLDKK